ncbi:MAG: hypothetical protein JNK67_24580 [Alphaproteobacteria bacterium]|nr:hypothetical protein [Alphaproteobacteria bacterium]
MTAISRLGALFAFIAAAIGPDVAASQVDEAARAFETECARCHTPDEIRQATSGIRRLYWTDDRLAAWLLRHHAHDEAQARLIIRFLRAQP